MIITIIRQRFIEDDVVDGDIAYRSTWTDEIDVTSVTEAADVLRGEGLTFAATGGAWAGDPDGSQIVDWHIGEREEVSAHFGPEWPDDIVAAIAEIVG